MAVKKQNPGMQAGVSLERPRSSGGGDVSRCRRCARTETWKAATNAEAAIRKAGGPHADELAAGLNMERWSIQPRTSDLSRTGPIRNSARRGLNATGRERNKKKLQRDFA